MRIVLGLGATVLSLVALALYGVAILASITIAATADDEVCCSLGQAESVLLWSLGGAFIASFIAGAVWITFYYRIAASRPDKDTPSTGGQ